MNDDNETKSLLSRVDPNNLVPGCRVYEPSSHREGEIIKIERGGRGLPDIIFVFDGSDTPCDAYDYPGLVVFNGD